MTIVTGLVLAMLFLGSAELVARGMLARGAVPLERPPLIPDRIGSPPPAPITHLTVHLPPAKSSRAWKRPLTTSISRIYQLPYSIDDPVVGFLPLSNVRSRAQASSSDGSLLYDVEYEIDPLRRRVTPQENLQSRTRPFLVFGCSFAFGEGVRGDQALGAVIARNAPKYRVYNYAFHGWSPGNAVRRVEAPGFGSDLPRGGGKAIFLFIDHHIQRMAGNLSILRAVPNWFSVIPYYHLNANGELQSDGMYADALPWRTRLFSFLAKSELLRLLGVDWPTQYNSADFRIVDKTLSSNRDRLSVRNGINEFVVVIYPGMQYGSHLIRALDELGIRSLDYSGVDWGKYLKENFEIPGDGHPSPAALQFLGEQIARDLKLAN